ncbi:HlyD family efflux transporter periplasmic adaptor subunit [Nibrella viscosa]|uniref:HlyD family efflux transporter periplasmic adaptor subunit n=1 Tax=Nibrella viscosa TaxID=1084524 RepID=A0ABP8L089_9BACT
MAQSVEFIELRSEEVQEVLSRPPRWLLRWGISLVFAVLVLVFAGAWLIRYPTLIKASFLLTTANAPKALVSRTEGKLVRLFASEGVMVQRGTTLAYLESTADHEEVLRLMQTLRQAWSLAQRGQLEALPALNLAQYHQLGELQPAFQTFEQTYIQLQAYLSNGFYSKKKVLLRQEIADLQALSENLKEQQALQQRDIELSEEDYQVQRRLAAEKVIAPLELKREESKNLARKFPYQQTASALITNLTLQRAKQKEILELDKVVAEQRDNFLHALNTLQSAAEAWKMNYIITAPMGGRVYFPSVLQENQHLSSNQELFYIAPAGTGYFGELRIPQHNFGKVKIGQAVLVKFAGYPYQEYGAVRGQIATINEVPLKDSVFLAKVLLPKGLETTYGQSLTFKTGMAASAEIITEDSRLLQKLFYQLRHVVNGSF